MLSIFSDGGFGWDHEMSRSFESNVPGSSRMAPGSGAVGNGSRNSKTPELLSYDEHNLGLNFVGRNETSKLEVNGWTRRLPVRFVGLRPDHKIRAVSSATPQNEMPTKLQPMINARVELKDIGMKAGPNKAKLPYPVLVTVLAKKAIDFIIKNKCVMMFGEILVGDMSGFCRLCAVNDSISSVYQQIQVGDKLLIGGAAASEFYPDNSSFLCVDEQYFLNLDLRLGMYDFRNVFKVEGVDDGKLPSYYTDNRKILTVTELIYPSLAETLELEGRPEAYYFDVIGVVSHVGRLERRRDFQSNVFLDDDEQSVPFFSVFRWIELIDQHSREPLPLQFYVGTYNWDIQSSLVPGSLLLATNVRRSVTDISPAITSTRFSKMYVNKEVKSYLDLFPDSAHLLHINVDFMGKNAKFILGRVDVEWSAGGSYSRSIQNEEAFVESFLFKPRVHPKLAAPPKICCRFISGLEDSFLPRESGRFSFKGFISQFQVVTSKGRECFTVNRNPEMKAECNERFALECKLVSSSFFSPEKNWFMFKRQLPKIDVENVRSPKPASATHFYEVFSGEYKKYCEPLLMPAQGDQNLLKDLPTLDCFPHIMMQIVNKEVYPNELYTCIWKQSRSMPLEKMISKLEKAVTCKSMCFLVDTHYTGDDPESKKKVIELILQDLVVGPEGESARLIRERRKT